MLPLFLSKITPPDSSIIEFDADGNLKRGIRTLPEVAHFVRCIPYKNHEYPNVWSSPDFLLTIKIGSIEEHALLMASMFRAVKYESIDDVEREIREHPSQKKKLNNELLVDGDMVFDEETK